MYDFALIALNHADAHSQTLQQEREGRDKEQRVVDQLRPEKEQFEARKDLELRVS